MSGKLSLADSLRSPFAAGVFRIRAATLIQLSALCMSQEYHEEIMLDDVWDGVLETFSEHPTRAFVFAQVLSQLKENLKREPDGSLLVIKALEDGIEKLYPYTNSHKASLQLYLLAVEGKLLPEHDPTLIVREL